ncbi:hypothetical protein K1T71_006082 [Dendrolimus kikuchii]|uniref:Uncharacterized protein n=1 Tax=Dendrolimus kikuchii TaxID=765133 RepID=A0ACC1D2T9_9NEOP|nr:hypothetical protein K1T71_006082 [Dendrolimus kikuchii]
MENAETAGGAVGGKREPSTDPVKAQGILTSVVKKEKYAAKLWKEKWEFFSKIREFQEEEAQKLGMSLNEYRAAVRSVNCQPEPKKYPVDAVPSPTPLPRTSSEGYSTPHFGLRAELPLVLQPSITSVEGDPISYKLPPARCEVTDEMWAQPQQVTRTPFSWSIEHVLEHDSPYSKY